MEALRQPPGLDSTMVTFIAAKSRHLKGFQSFWMFWKGLMPLSTIMQELKCPEMSEMSYGVETRPECPEMSGNHNTCKNRVQKNAMIESCPYRARGFPDTCITQRIGPIHAENLVSHSGARNVRKCPEILIFRNSGHFGTLGSGTTPPHTPGTL